MHCGPQRVLELVLAVLGDRNRLVVRERVARDQLALELPSESQSKNGKKEGNVERRYLHPYYSTWCFRMNYM